MANFEDCSLDSLTDDQALQYLHDCRDDCDKARKRARGVHPDGGVYSAWSRHVAALDWALKRVSADGY